MSSRYARPAAAVRALYRRLDRRIASFRRASGLGCPPGCGECCLSPEVEATVLEMLPLALDLRRRGLLEPTLARLGPGGEPPRPCLFYSPAPLGAFGGHCSVYPWRPLLCRLFGFAAVAGPEGRPELAVCGRMRAALPDRSAGGRGGGAGRPPARPAHARLVPGRLPPGPGAGRQPSADQFRPEAGPGAGGAGAGLARATTAGSGSGFRGNYSKRRIDPEGCRWRSLPYHRQGRYRIARPRIQSRNIRSMETPRLPTRWPMPMYRNRWAT